MSARPAPVGSIVWAWCPLRSTHDELAPDEEPRPTVRFYGGGRVGYCHSCGLRVAMEDAE